MENMENIKLYYDKFLKRYIEDLTDEDKDSKLEPPEIRSEKYIADIIKKVAFQKANLQFPNKISLLKEQIGNILTINSNKILINPPDELQQEDFINEQISCAFNTTTKYNKNDNNPFNIPNKITFLSYHNGPTIRMKQVPKNCLLVVLTPLNRFGYGDVKIFDYFIKLLKDINNENKFYTEFMKNPVCYQKQIVNSLFYEANIYFPNQYYYDIGIGKTKPGEEGYNESIGKEGTFLNYENNEIVKYQQETESFHMSEFLKKFNVTGIVITHGCRNIDADDKISIDEGATMYRYEHFMNILNQTATAFDDKDYEYCNTATSIEEIDYSLGKKVNEHYSGKYFATKKNNSSKKTTSNKKDLLSKIVTNKTIGVRRKSERKIKKLCETIITNFTSINPLSNNLSKQYNHAWGVYNLCKKKLGNLDEQIIGILKSKGVNMDIFFSCAISKLISDVKIIIELYTKLKANGVTIKNIYLNGIDLNQTKNSILGNLMYFLYNNEEFRNSLENIHLANTHFKFKDKDNYVLTYLYFSDSYPNLKDINIANNNFSEYEINEFINNSLSKNGIFYSNINQNLVNQLKDFTRLNKTYNNTTTTQFNTTTPSNTTSPSNTTTIPQQFNTTTPKKFNTTTTPQQFNTTTNTPQQINTTTIRQQNTTTIRQQNTTTPSIPTTTTTSIPTTTTTSIPTTTTPTTSIPTTTTPTPSIPTHIETKKTKKRTSTTKKPKKYKTLRKLWKFIRRKKKTNKI
jgi:hypothetical protein